MTSRPKRRLRSLEGGRMTIPSWLFHGTKGNSIGILWGYPFCWLRNGFARTSCFFGDSSFFNTENRKLKTVHNQSWVVSDLMFDSRIGARHAVRFSLGVSMDVPWQPIISLIRSWNQIDFYPWWWLQGNIIRYVHPNYSVYIMIYIYISLYI